jgi:hypothetical protein
MGGRYNQIMWDVQDTAVNPTSSFDHNFLAGKWDRGCSLVLDARFIRKSKTTTSAIAPAPAPAGRPTVGRRSASATAGSARKHRR